jgi:phage shock protein A
MAEGGFFSRITNLWSGFLSLFVGNIEKENPEAVYEAAIQARKRKYDELKKAVSGIIVLRNKLSKELDEKTAELNELDAQIRVAVEQDEDEVALVLLQRKEDTEKRVTSIEGELEQAREDAEAAKASIVTFQAEIEKLQREKAATLAKLETAEARIKIQETLDGMSLDADIQALDNVRDHVARKQAEADVNSEIGDAEIGSKLKKIQAQAGTATARNKLEALKKARDSERAQKAGAAQAVKKQI